MAIISFDFDPSRREMFLDIGYELYQGDPFWIPPLREDLRTQLSPEFSFYSKAGNRFRHFLVATGGKTVGRVSAIVNSALHDRDGTPVGTIGFFECGADYAVASELLHAATSWLQGEAGVERIWAPMNFDIWHGYRFMTAGFGERPFYGEPYNKPYYPEFFLRYGFVDKERWNSIEVTGRRSLEGMFSRDIQRYRELMEDGYRFEHLDMTNFPEELQKLHSVLTSSYRGFLGYTPISPEEFSALYTKLRYAADPRFFVFAYDNMGVLAGFAGAFLELSDAVRAMDGRDTLLGRIKFLAKRRRVDRINFYIVGLTPEEVVKRSGLGRAVYAYVLRRLLDAGYETVLFALILQGSRARGLLGKDAPRPQREYALFELNP